METSQQRRTRRDEELLEGGCVNGPIIKWRKLEERVYEIEFRCEEGNHYTIRLCLPTDYPFRAPSAFFIGDAPRHPFYWWDTDDAGRAKRITNLANTDFGLFYGTWSPSRNILSYVEKLCYSLTEEGTNEMKDFMQSKPLVINNK